jgi:hypothetical protein
VKSIGRVALAAVLAAGGTAAGGQPQERPIRLEIQTQGLPPQVAQRLQQEARKGRNAVIRYINRTRMVHGLRAEEILRPAGLETGRRGVK